MGETDLKNEGLVDVLLGGVHVEVGAFDEAQEELVDDPAERTNVKPGQRRRRKRRDELQVRPSELENGLILLGIEGISGGVDLRRN